MLRRACDDSAQGRMKWRIAMAGLGDLLGSVRRARRVSGRKMAYLMGISPSYLSLLEDGKRDWTEAIIGKWDWAMADLYADHVRFHEVSETANEYP